MHACLGGKTLQVTDFSQRWSYLQRKASRRQSLSAWLLFSNSDRLYSGSKAPVTCPLYPSTPFHCCTLCKVHTFVLPSYAALKIPRLSLPCNVQIWQLYFVRGLMHWSDIPCMDPSTPHICRNIVESSKDIDLEINKEKPGSQKTETIRYHGR
jgi:hypothetical protein